MTRLTGAWRGMSRELRMAVIAAFLLFASMFLPWYEKSYFVSVRGKLAQASDGLNAFQAFSFVEAAVLLVAIAVVVLCFARGERRAFHLPGGDGVVVMAAGGWVGLLLVYRLFDKPDASVPGGAAVTVGIQWGIFFALAAAGFLVYTGYRIYSAHRPEPPLPGEVDTSRREEVAPARRETRATEPLIRDQRRPATPEDPGTAPVRRRIPPGPPSDEARAAADRQAQQHRPPTLPLDPPAAPAPPPEFPHSAGHAPPWQSPADATDATEALPPQPPDEPVEDETVAMPGRQDRRRDDAEDEPDTLF
jgi:hypothetical protein